MSRALSLRVRWADARRSRDRWLAAARCGSCSCPSGRRRRVHACPSYLAMIAPDARRALRTGMAQWHPRARRHACAVRRHRPLQRRHRKARTETDRLYHPKWMFTRSADSKTALGRYRHYRYLTTNSIQKKAARSRGAQVNSMRRNRTKRTKQANEQHTFA